MKKHLFLIGILLLAAFLRLWQLGIIPVGVTHDEMGYIYNAYSIATTGNNVFGQHIPLFTWMVTNGFPSMPATMYLSVPFFWILPLSATAGRLPGALLGVIDVFLLYLVVKNLFANKPLALLSALFLAISPWHIHFSRSAYDINIAFFYYLFGTTLFLYANKKIWMLLLSIVFFLFAVFSYRGMSIIAFPLLITLLIYGINVLKMKASHILIFSIGIAVIGIAFFAAIKTYGTAYTQEALFWKDPKIQDYVDNQSRSAQAPLWVKRIFLNKPMFIAQIFRENYVRSYSPEFLFLYTEPNKIYSIWSRGRLYFFDLLLLPFGIAYLFMAKKKSAILVVALLLIGGLPCGFGGMPYSSRNFFLSAMFPIFTAGGVLFIYQLKIFKKIKPLIIIAFALIYTFLLCSYLFDYYARYAYDNGEAWAKSIKDMSNYVIKNENKYDNVIVGQTSFGDLVQYAFYAKISPQKIQKLWKNKPLQTQPSFTIDHITFQIDCLPKKQIDKSTLYMSHDPCLKNAKPVDYIRDYPGNIVWRIYNNK